MPRMRGMGAGNILEADGMGDGGQQAMAEQATAGTLGFGVVGLGMGRHHCRSIRNARGAHLVAVCDTRRELAEQYLNRLQLSLGEAAYLLGFSEQSSFFRACKRWFGLPPGEYRRQLHRATAAARKWDH
jgi:methylphosphotriester-DNA--protein-cysteine methyltransferase